MKRILETKAAKSLSAFVVMKRHRMVAKVLAHHSDNSLGGATVVEVYNFGDKNRTTAKGIGVQRAKATGCGYDRLTSALSGMEIDGHVLCNHCEERKAPKDFGLERFPRDFKEPRGWALANWQTRERVQVGDDWESVDLPAAEQGYTDLYKVSGLDLLRHMGYEVYTIL